MLTSMWIVESGFVLNAEVPIPPLLADTLFVRTAM